ncbi:MAG: CapA family protein [Clostridia bacterium]|nr:CapA family protein [Clostridia bacterium]
MNRFIRLFCAMLALLLLTTACATSDPVTPQIVAPERTEQTPEESVPAQDPIPKQDPASEPPAPEPIHIRITAVGDNLLHNTLSIDSMQDDGSYNFFHLYEQIAPIIAGSDIAFVNQEVMLTGEVSAYPNLAAPAEAADALLQAGFNVVNLATNHSLDKGVAGLETCLENVHQRDFEAVLGAFRSEEEASAFCVLEKQGIRFGFLSYTYGLNGYSLPKDKSYQIALIDEVKIAEDMEAICPLCDYLIVSMHWGNEYQLTASSYQMDLAQMLCDHGADLIIGTHPHVLEPVEWYDSEAGNRTLCAYSLGNFVSGQHKLPTMLGGILDVRLTFDPETHQLLTTDSAGIIPTVTHYRSKGGYCIYPLQNYTEALAAEHGIKNYDKPMTLDYLNDLAVKVLGDFVTTWESDQ